MDNFNIYKSADFATNVFNTIFILRDDIAAKTPKNFVSGKNFGGKNADILTSDALTHGYKSCLYATYKQIESIGGSVKGQKGTKIVIVVDAKKENEEEVLKDTQKKYVKHLTVFNIQQIHDARLDDYLDRNELKDYAINLDDPQTLAQRLELTSSTVRALAYHDNSVTDDEIKAIPLLDSKTEKKAPAKKTKKAAAVNTEKKAPVLEHVENTKIDIKQLDATYKAETDFYKKKIKSLAECLGLKLEQIKQAIFDKDILQSWIAE